LISSIGLPPGRGTPAKLIPAWSVTPWPNCAAEHNRRNNSDRAGSTIASAADLTSFAIDFRDGEVHIEPAPFAVLLKPFPTSSVYEGEYASAKHSWGKPVPNAIETSGLIKTFGATRALAGVDLRIREGSVYGLLGPNGAGKTTIIRILATLLRPDAGTATVLGHDVVRQAKAVRQKVSLTGQYASVDEDLTGQENLVLMGRLLGLPWRGARRRSSELLEAFGLAEAAGRQVQTYSGGMRRRIDIAASLVAIPQILFLDEPTTGLDPRSRNQVWDLVRRIADEGTTVLLTTQYLDEADRLAERMAVIDHGRVIAEGTSRELKASVGASALHVRLASADQRERAQELVARVLGDGVVPATDPTTVTARLANPAQAAAVLTALTQDSVEVAEFSVGNPTLDEVFFALTGRPAEEAAHEAKP
jgi:ABC-2 type transport system ATP-binding protein